MRLLRAFWQHLQQSAEAEQQREVEAYLAQAVDLQDLERREQQLYRSDEVCTR